jgi:pre-rRNA-processing protein TSR3
MVRHKKENFSRGGKKFSNPRSRPVPRGDDNGDGEEGVVSARPAFKAACWDMGHCDPKRCSGKRLMKLGLMRDLHIGQRHPGVIVSYARQFTHELLAPMRRRLSPRLIESSWSNMVLQ